MFHTTYKKQYTENESGSSKRRTDYVKLFGDLLGVAHLIKEVNDGPRGLNAGAEYIFASAMPIVMVAIREDRTPAGSAVSLDIKHIQEDTTQFSPLERLAKKHGLKLQGTQLVGDEFNYYF